MIPKIIHYCWFGGKPIPDKLKRYMASWKKQLPDYQVMEWNENNFDVYSHPFVKEAYEKRKFAFVSDYVRIFALYNYGGIYLDTDVEVCKTFDMILGYKGFVSMEPETNLISTCCIGFEKKHPLAKNILQSYDTLKLDGTPNTVLFYNLIKNEYSGFNGDNVECDFGDIHIFSSKFISLSKKYLDNYIIHYLSATWLSPWNRFKQKIILVALKNKTTATMYKCYKKLVGGGKKIIFHGLKLLVSFVNYLSPRIATAMFIKA